MLISFNTRIMHGVKFKRHWYMTLQKNIDTSIFFPYTKEEIDKLGNAIIYLANKISPLSKDKLLKLVYLIEEISIKKHGLPVFNVKFLVWKSGPIAKDLFIELSSEPILLNRYISCEEKGGNTFIIPRKLFSDNEFSDNDINILDLIIEKFGNTSTEELTKFTNREHTLWHNTAREEGVLEFLENECINNTEIEIDFSRLLEGNSLKEKIYLQQKEYLAQSRSLKF